MPAKNAPTSLRETPGFMQPVTKKSRAKDRLESDRQTTTGDFTWKEKASASKYATGPAAEKLRRRSDAIERARASQVRMDEIAEERRLLMEERGEELRAVASKGQLEEVKAMLAHRGAGMYPVDHVNYEGLTPLMKASMYGHAAVVAALVVARADVNLTDGHGRTPLMLAAQNGETETVDALLNGGARPLFGAAEHGMTALMLASVSGHGESVRLLLTAGAPADPVNNEGKRALEIVQELVERGSTISKENSISLRGGGDFEGVLKQLEEHEARVAKTGKKRAGWKKVRRLSAAAAVATAFENADGREQRAGRFAQMLEGAANTSIYDRTAATLGWISNLGRESMRFSQRVSESIRGSFRQGRREGSRHEGSKRDSWSSWRRSSGRSLREESIAKEGSVRDATSGGTLGALEC